MLETTEITGTERLVRAVLDHRVVRFRYHGQARTVEPQLVGLHEAGEPMLVGYQTAGGSNSGEVPGWRTFITMVIEELEVLPEGFAAARGDLALAAEPMREIFARA
jgi:hypothetical protein